MVMDIAPDTVPIQSVLVGFLPRFKPPHFTITFLHHCISVFCPRFNGWSALGGPDMVRVEHSAVAVGELDLVSVSGIPMFGSIRNDLNDLCLAPCRKSIRHSAIKFRRDLDFLAFVKLCHRHSPLCEAARAPTFRPYPRDA